MLVSRYSIACGNRLTQMGFASMVNSARSSAGCRFSASAVWLAGACRRHTGTTTINTIITVVVDLTFRHVQYRVSVVEGCLRVHLFEKTVDAHCCVRDNHS